MKVGIIYLITNTVNGKKYVGQTVKTLTRRWNGHKSSANNENDQLICKAIRKYGPNAFTIEVICETLASSLSTAEIFFIKFHKSRIHQHGYNMTDGGEGTRGYSPSETTRRKQSLKKKDKPVSTEHRQKIGHANKGRSPASKNKPMSDEQKQKLRLASNNRQPISEETRQRQRDAACRRWARVVPA